MHAAERANTRRPQEVNWILYIRMCLIKSQLKKCMIVFGKYRLTHPVRVGGTPETRGTARVAVKTPPIPRTHVMACEDAGFVTFTSWFVLQCQQGISADG